MKNNNVSRMTYTAVLAALYVALTLINPIGWGMFQFRLSEALCVLPFFDRKNITGVVIGVAMANAFSPIGVFDVGAGVLTAVIVYTISKYIKNKYLNAIIHGTVSGLVIGAMLYYVLGLPFLMSFVSIAASTIAIAVTAVYLIDKNEAAFKRSKAI